VPDPRWSAEGSPYLVYTRRGKRARSVPSTPTPARSDDSNRSEVVAQQPSRERPKARARAKSDPGPREGLGEGEHDDQGDELPDEAHAPW